MKKIAIMISLVCIAGLLAGCSGSPDGFKFDGFKRGDLLEDERGWIFLVGNVFNNQEKILFLKYPGANWEEMDGHIFLMRKLKVIHSDNEKHYEKALKFLRQ